MAKPAIFEPEPVIKDAEQGHMWLSELPEQALIHILRELWSETHHHWELPLCMAGRGMSELWYVILF
jgi:hypothetical protein